MEVLGITNGVISTIQTEIYSSTLYILSTGNHHVALTLGSNKYWTFFPVAPNASDQKILVPKHVLFGETIPDLPSPDQNVIFEIDDLRIVARQAMELDGWTPALCVDRRYRLRRIFAAMFLDLEYCQKRFCLRLVFMK